MGHGFSNQPHLRDNVGDGWVWTRPSPTPCWVWACPRPTPCWTWTPPRPTPCWTWTRPSPTPHWAWTQPRPTPCWSWTHQRSTPRWAWTRPRLIIFGCSHKLYPFSPGPWAWIEPNIPQIGCEAEGSFYTYHEPELIIMRPIIIPLNTNKPSIFILIRCDGTISKIILSYSYNITFLPLSRCMRQWKNQVI